MTHQGRVHSISRKAEEISELILGSIPKEKVLHGRLRRPLWYQIAFQDTTDEKAYLTSVANRYNAQRSSDENLVAHGTQDCSTLCQILLDGALKHVKGIENYGNLGAGGGHIQLGDYWDHGWGVFVATPKTIQTQITASQHQPYLVIPLQSIRAVLLPGQLVPIVQSAFPQHTTLLKSYRQFGQELESLL